MGYERAMYFKKDKEPSETNFFLGLDVPKEEEDKEEGPVMDDTNTMVLAETPTFFKPPWFDEVREEFLSTRRGVTMCDYSSFAKFDLWSAGTEAVKFLQYMCSKIEKKGVMRFMMVTFSI